MIKRGRHVIKNHMTLEYDFSGIRIQDSVLTPVDWNLQVNMVAPGAKGKTREEIEKEAGITYQKIYFWLDSNLTNMVAADVGNEDDLYIANLTSNIMMYCPGNPGDDMLIQLLHAKITSLAKPDLLIGELHLKGSDTSLQYTFDCPNGEYDLPKLTSEYYTEGTIRDTIPWWYRDDGFSFEFVKPDDCELTEEEMFSDIIDPMIEFRKFVDEIAESHINMSREPAKILQVEKWKPKKI